MGVMHHSAKPKNARELGERFYFFESKVPSDECIISAHGGYWRGTKSFTVTWPDVRICFYGVHGKALDDPGVKFLEGNPEVVESFTHGQSCNNYILSKYQERGSWDSSTDTPAESFAGIETSLESVKTTLKMREDLLQRLTVELMDLSDEDLKMVGAVLENSRHVRGFHVLTVRHRRLRADVNLHDAITAVRASYPGINVFHCSFCRSNQHLPS